MRITHTKIGDSFLKGGLGRSVQGGGVLMSGVQEGYQSRLGGPGRGVQGWGRMEGEYYGRGGRALGWDSMFRDK